MLQLNIVGQVRIFWICLLKWNDLQAALSNEELQSAETLLATYVMSSHT